MKRKTINDLWIIWNEDPQGQTFAMFVYETVSLDDTKYRGLCDIKDPSEAYFFLMDRTSYNY